MDPLLLSDLVLVLQACRDYLDDRADCSTDEGVEMPNQAMRLLENVDEMLVKLALVGAK